MTAEAPRDGPISAGLSPAAARRLPLAGALIWLERGLAAELGWIVAAWIGFAALALFGAASWLPGEMRLAIVGALIVGSVGGAIRYAARTPLPARSVMLARLDTGGALPRGTVSFTDSAPVGLSDRIAEQLWRRARRDALARQPRIGLPRIQLPPYLKWSLIGAALILLAGLLAANRTAPQRLSAAFSPYAVPATDYAFRVEITPPEYAVLPVRQIALQGGATRELRLLTDSQIDVSSTGAAAEWQLVDPAGEFMSLPASVTRGGQWRIAAHGRTLATLNVGLAADDVPDIRFNGSPVKTASGALRLGYRLADDHGLSALSLLVEGGAADPVVTDLNMSVAPGEGQLFADLTSDPRAGEQARLTLLARDGAGNVGRSPVMLLTLPVRSFVDEVAAEIIAVRKDLLEGADRREVVRRLTRIATQPERFDQRLDTFVALRAATWRLLRDRRKSARTEVAQILWDTAVDLEDGGTSRAMNDLRTAMEQLMKQAGTADDSTLAALTERLESAMGEYLARQIEAAMAAGETPSAEALQSMAGMASSMDAGFLDAMMQDLKDRLAAGDTEGAMQALSNLRGLMESIQFGSSPPDPEAMERAQATNELAQQLRDVESQQSALREETIAEAVRQMIRDDPQAMQAMGTRQQELGESLDQISGAFAETGAESPAELNEARQAMQAAADALAAGDAASAATAQTLALDKLAQAGEQASAAAQAMAQAAAGGQMQPGGDGSGLDPLGRPGRGFGQGEVDLPDENALRRVQEIREIIEERAADPARTPTERAYYLRLLKRF
ncbi:DUF4175 family protein [Pacificimonas sp. ICDLI1SI03]